MAWFKKQPKPVFKAPPNNDAIKKIIGGSFPNNNDAQKLFNESHKAVIQKWAQSQQQINSQLYKSGTTTTINPNVGTNTLPNIRPYINTPNMDAGIVMPAIAYWDQICYTVTSYSYDTEVQKVLAIFMHREQAERFMNAQEEGNCDYDIVEIKLNEGDIPVEVPENVDEQASIDMSQFMTGQYSAHPLNPFQPLNPSP